MKQERWTIPTCPKCGSLVTTEPTYGGGVLVCETFGCDAYSLDPYRQPEPVEIEVVPA